MTAQNEEFRLLQDSAKAFMAKEAPLGALRTLRDGASGASFDARLWAKMVELGWPGIAIPEAQGGSGLGFAGLGLVLEAAGAHLAPAPLLSCAMIAPAAFLLAGNPAQHSQYLPQIAAGQAVFALAVDESTHHAPAETQTRAFPEGASWRVTGEKRMVADGQSADHLLVSARRPDGNILLLRVAAKSEGIAIQALRTADGRGAADIRFDGAPGEALGDGPAPIDAVLDHARIGCAAEMLGQAQAAFESTADYLRTRTQFGQVIGAFQALQHRAAAMLVDLELTRSCVLAALQGLDEGASDIPVLASLAKARAGETLHAISREMVQLHGGIGMTDAHDAGLYLKRARTLEALYGSASFHRDRYARLMGY